MWRKWNKLYLQRCHWFGSCAKPTDFWFHLFQHNMHLYYSDQCSFKGPLNGFVRCIHQTECTRFYAVTVSQCSMKFVIVLFFVGCRMPSLLYKNTTSSWKCKGKTPEERSRRFSIVFTLYLHCFCLTDSAVSLSYCFVRFLPKCDDNGNSTWNQSNIVLDVPYNPGEHRLFPIKWIANKAQGVKNLFQKDKWRYW